MTEYPEIEEILRRRKDRATLDGYEEYCRSMLAKAAALDSRVAIHVRDKLRVNLPWSKMICMGMRRHIALGLGLCEVHELSLDHYIRMTMAGTDNQPQPE